MTQQLKLLLLGICFTTNNPERFNQFGFPVPNEQMKLSSTTLPLLTTVSDFYGSELPVLKCVLLSSLFIATERALP